MAEPLEIASDNTDLWGRDLNATFMVQDLKRSGLRATDFPHGCEMLPLMMRGRSVTVSE